VLLDLGSFTRWATLSRYFAHQKDTLALDSKIIIIIITDLYSAFRSEDTEALVVTVVVIVTAIYSLGLQTFTGSTQPSTLLGMIK